MFKRFFLLFIVLSIALGACHLPPDLDDVPRITFRNMYFLKQVPVDSLPQNNPNQLSYNLVLEFDFEDGNGDIGLDDSFTDLKFQRYEIIRDDEGNEIRYGDSPDLPPFNLKDYEVIYKVIEGKPMPIDTLLVRRNENHYNLFVRLYSKKNGQYHYYDPWINLNQTFNARIPVIRRDVKSTQGTIKYKWFSTAWEFMVPNDTVKIEFYIKDRALNQSNTVETPEFLIRQLLKEAK